MVERLEMKMAVLVANVADDVEVEAKRSQQQEDKTPRGCLFLSLASCGLFLVCAVLYFWNAEIAGEEVKGTLLIDSPLASSHPVADPQNRRLASLPQTVVIKEKKADPKKYAAPTLPTVLLAGAQKGGTSALAFWLQSSNSQNDGVCGPKRFPGEPDFYEKEVHFFDMKKRYNTGVKFYERRFEHCYHNLGTTRYARNKQGIILSLDGTPDVFMFPERIFETYQTAGQLDTLKIIFSLREPVARDMSWFNHLKSLQYQPDGGGKLGKRVGGSVRKRTYDEYARALTMPVLRGERRDTHRQQLGMYSKFLTRWFDLFSRRQILVLSYDEVLNDPVKARWRVEEFLGERFPVSEKSNNWKKTNDRKFSQKQKYPLCSTQKELDSLFRPLNQQLYKLLDSTKEDRPPMEQHPFPKFQLGECTE